MKAINMIKKTLLIGFIVTLSANIYAQESMDATSKPMMKTILDNEKVMVMQVEYAPGQVSPMNNYPEHVAYVLEGGKMEMTQKGKDAKVMDLNEGEAMYMPASNDIMFKNVGTTTVKIVVTAMKSGHKMMKGETSMDKDKDSKSW